MAHEKHKLLIPLLDLTNLPPDSDDEEANNAAKQKSIQNQPVESGDIFLEENLGSNQMNNSSAFLHQRSLSMVSQSKNNYSSVKDSLNKFNQSGVKDSVNNSRVMDLLSQVDALNAQDQEDNDLEELAQFDMHMG